MPTVVKTGEPVLKPLTISFSVEELQAMCDVLICVGGDPRNSRRSIIDGINTLLHENGYKWSQADINKPASVYFKDK